MTLHRCLLIACVTLSQACDSKRTTPVAEKPAAVALDAQAIPQIAVGPDEPAEKLFEALRAAQPAEQFVLAIGSARHRVHYTARAIADGPGMVGTLGANGRVQLWSTSGSEGTAERPKLETPLDEAGINTIRAALADVATRTGAKRIDVVVDRAQLARVLGALIEAVRPPFEDVRVVAAVPTTPTGLRIHVGDAGALQDVIAAGARDLQQCFDESLRRDGPISSLRLAVAGTVDDKGQFLQISVGGAHAPKLGDCVSVVVRGWSFTTVKPGRYSFHIDMRAQ